MNSAQSPNAIRDPRGRITGEGGGGELCPVISNSTLFIPRSKVMEGAT